MMPNISRECFLKVIFSVRKTRLIVGTIRYSSPYTWLTTVYVIVLSSFPVAVNKQLTGCSIFETGLCVLWISNSPFSFFSRKSFKRSYKTKQKQTFKIKQIIKATKTNLHDDIKNNITLLSASSRWPLNANYLRLLLKLLLLW